MSFCFRLQVVIPGSFNFILLLRDFAPPAIPVVSRPRPGSREQPGALLFQAVSSWCSIPNKISSFSCGWADTGRAWSILLVNERGAYYSMYNKWFLSSCFWFCSETGLTRCLKKPWSGAKEPPHGSFTQKDQLHETILVWNAVFTASVTFESHNSF